MRNFELVFVPGPGMGHLGSLVEMANILVTRDRRLSVTVLAIKLPFDTKTAEHLQSLSASLAGKSIRFAVLPEAPLPQEGRKGLMLKGLLENYKPIVREAVAELAASRTAPDSPRLGGFVIDMFCTTMIDVAKEFDLPCYVYYTSSAGFLSLSFHLQELYDRNGSNEAVEELQNSGAELALPSFANPLPCKAVPGVFFDNDAAVWLYDNAKKFRTEIDGILINTFAELESNVMNWMSSCCSSSQVPPSYFVGPVLQLNNTGAATPERTPEAAEALKWLDEQPPSSVVFLCFGSMGSFEEDQVKEIAVALERSGVRFVWSLRQPPPKDKFDTPKDYDDVKSVLPEGFLERTSEIGRVIGWAPQVEILGHRATGGFVSHCGWNSTLESLWQGVPIATWPIHAEQQLNAFQMTVELGLAAEITLDYRKNFQAERSRVVGADEIERGVRRLMEGELAEERRKKVKAKSAESRRTVNESGSSFIALGRFIEDLWAHSAGEGRD